MAAPPKQGPSVPGLPIERENKLMNLGLTANDLVNIFVVEAANVLVEPLSAVTAPDPDTEEAPPIEYPYHFSDEQESDSFDSACSHSISELEHFRKRLVEDERLSQIYKLRHNFSDRFDNRSYIHPHGTTNFDYKAIKEDRKKGFERFKNKVRRENYMYLGSHPEIRGIISMFLKKLLTTQPPDPALYLAEFMTTSLKSNDFQTALENEMKRISRYRVNKMCAKGWIKRGSPAAQEPDTAPGTGTEEEEKLPPEVDVNIMKKLNIGPLAQDFYFDASFMPKKKEVKEEEKPKKKKKKKHVYCGCKDFKVKGKKKECVGCGKPVGPESTAQTSEGEGESEAERPFDEEGNPMDSHDASRMASQIVSELMDAFDGVHH